MLRPYREVLATPGALAFSAAGLLARLPISMLGIGIVLLVSAQTGSYALAGAVAATFGLVQAVAAPQVARLVDRLGQARVLRPVIGVHVIGLLALVAAVTGDAPTWALFAGAVVAGAAALSVGSLVRTRWSYLLDGSRRLHTAYSLESVLDEVVFIVGPVVVTVLATRVAPAAGLLTAAGAALVGGWLLAAQRRTEPPLSPAGAAPRTPVGHATDGTPGTAAPAASRRTNAVLRAPGMPVLVLTFCFVGGLFGSVEVLAVAFAEERGSPGAAGVVLACFATGSLVAGLAYGSVHWRRPPAQQFLGAVALLAAGSIPFALVTTIPALAAVMLLAGLSISPMIISGYALVGLIAPVGRLTEGLTWTTTALGLGTSVAAATTGAAVDAVGAHRAFLVPVVAAVLAAAVAGLCYGRLARTGAGTTEGSPAVGSP